MSVPHHPQLLEPFLDRPSPAPPAALCHEPVHIQPRTRPQLPVTRAAPHCHAHQLSRTSLSRAFHTSMTSICRRICAARAPCSFCSSASIVAPSTCVHAHVCVCIYICACVHARVCVYIYTCVYMYSSVHTQCGHTHFDLATSRAVVPCWY